MLITLFGVVAAATMVTAYGFESRDPKWVAVFAVGCAATAIYGVITGAWIFAVLETIWAGVATKRFLAKDAEPHPNHGLG